MSITLTANYKETLSTETVEKIDELLEDNYELSDILEFIDAHSEDDFVSYYEEYVRCGEAIGYEAVDALIEEMGDVSYIEDCDKSIVVSMNPLPILLKNSTVNCVMFLLHLW